MDVLEHIFPEEESRFMCHLAGSLAARGVAVIGPPNASADTYASENSKIGHVNLKQGEQLRALCQQYFHNVFMFGMNDEVVHTGFLPMSHYLMALCVGPRDVR